jgi:hypothetical protein
MSRLGAKGGGSLFDKALENKKSSEIALRLNSCEKRCLLSRLEAETKIIVKKNHLL